MSQSHADLFFGPSLYDKEKESHSGKVPTFDVLLHIYKYIKMFLFYFCISIQLLKKKVRREKNHQQ